MSAREHLAWAVRHGLSVPASEVEAIVDECLAEGDGREVGTVQAMRVLGYSTRFWRLACEKGEIDGAFLAPTQDGTGRWRFTLRAARAYLLRRRHRVRKKGRRGPNRKAPSAQAARAGATDLPPGKVLALRPKTVERDEGGDAGPRASEMAG